MPVRSTLGFSKPPIIKIIIESEGKIKKGGIMALINCPDCGKSISDQAPTCPQCGRAMAVAAVKSEGCFLQTLNIGCAIIVGFIVLVFVLVLVMMASR
jgi:zinc-ribbon domain